MANIPELMQITIAQAVKCQQKYAQEQHNLHEMNRWAEEKSFTDWMAQVSPVIAGDGAIDVPWCGMHLCIEKDGHCHS